MVEWQVKRWSMKMGRMKEGQRTYVLERFFPTLPFSHPPIHPFTYLVKWVQEMEEG